MIVQVQMHKNLILMFVFLFFSVAQAQVTTNSSSGLAATYTSLADAITALNASAITSTVVITLSGNETAPAGGYNITATGTSTNTITIQGSSSTITAPSQTTLPSAAGILTDAIFKIVGGDYITIQGFTMQERSFTPADADIAAATNNMTEFGVALFYATTANGAQNCTIQNNTITLNRAYQNTFGIYSNSTHSATDVTAFIGASANGGNSNLKIYGNNIGNVNMGIVVIGPLAAADFNTGIDIGGTALETGNTISNFGTTGTFSAYNQVSTTLSGILVRDSIGFNVSNNSITSSNGGITSSATLRGIYIPAFLSPPTGTFTNTINNNTIALTHGFTSGAIQGITVETATGTATSTQNINNNNFTALRSSALATSGTITAISNVMPNLVNNFNGNTFTDITSNTTGSFTFFAYGYTMPAGGSQTFNGNSIVTGFSKTGAGGAVTISTCNGTSPSGTFHSFTNNNFSRITVTGFTQLSGSINSDSFSSTSSPTRTVTGNTFEYWTGGLQEITAFIYTRVGGTTSTISNNTLTNITGQSTITGISIGSSANATMLYVASNIINNLTSTGGKVVGLTCSNASPTININGNVINTLSSTSNFVRALIIGGGATTNVFQNKIYNISVSSASQFVNGILISGGANINVYNNIIGDLRATAASGTDVIIGINIIPATASSTRRIYGNTIYLNATSSGANFGSTGIYHTYSAAGTTAALDMRNNIIVNSSVANGTGLSVAFRRSAATDLANYATTSNNNLFFGTSGVYNNGTTTYNFADFQTLVSTRETASKSQNPSFASTTGADANFLNFANGAFNMAGGNAQIIASPYNTDYSQVTRDGSTPDIGAFEFAQGITRITTAPTASSIVYGQTLASSTLSNGAASVAGTFAFTTPSTTPALGTANQDYTFTPTDTTNYTSVTGSVNVTVTQATPSITTAPSASNIVYGQTLASSTLSGGAASVTGTFAFTTPSTAPNAGTANQDYTFTPTDATNYTTITGTVSVTVTQAAPSITFDANGGSGTMANQSIAYLASANLRTNAFTRTGYTFAGWATTNNGALAYANSASYTMGSANVTLFAQWDALPATPVVSVLNNCGTSTLSTTATGTLSWSTGETTSSITVSSSGDYTVTQTVDGYTSIAGSGTASPKTIPSRPTLTAGSTTTFCSGGSVVLTASAGTTYLWSNGAATQSITATTEGSYTVNVTNANSCQSAESATTTVTINPAPAKPTKVNSWDNFVFNTTSCSWDNTGTATNTTTIIDSLKDSTLTSLSAVVTCYPLANATSYRFKIVTSGTNAIRYYVSTTNSFNLTKVPGTLYSTPYAISVAVYMARSLKTYGLAYTVTTPTPYTKIQDAQCGQTLTSMVSGIVANAVIGVTNYRFKVVANGETRILESVSRVFQLTSLVGGALHNTAYTISVATKYNGVWRDYGTECIVRTPTGLSKIVETQCGNTLATVGSSIVANAIAGVTNYRFKVVANGEEKTIESVSRAFQLSSLSGGAFFNTAYTISVATKYNGAWGDYGTECIVRTPTGLTKIQDSQCGTTVASLGTTIVANYVYGATHYRYKVVANGVERTIERTSRIFQLTSLVGGVVNNTTYTISVATKYNGKWGDDYGDECAVSTPNTMTARVAKPATTAIAKEKVIEEASVLAYPSPFTTNFKLNFISSSKSNIAVAVYDMTGRQIENRTVNSAEINNIAVGDNYPSGVYNVLVTQGAAIKTLRVIKK